MTGFHSTRSQFTDAAKELEGGRRFRDQGVYLGRSDIRDERGASLGIYYHFAAPHNLYANQTFMHTAPMVSNLRDWHGHHGFKIHNPYLYEQEIIAGFRSGAAEGKWAIPSSDMLKKLWVLLEAPDVKDTLTLQGYPASAWHFSYHGHPHEPNLVNIDNVVEHGQRQWVSKHNVLASCRPCRSVRVDQLRL